MQLLEYCLKVNPKAYAIWFHREWVMSHSPSPDWGKECTLCNLFLKYDERNCKREEREGMRERGGGKGRERERETHQSCSL